MSREQSYGYTREELQTKTTATLQSLRHHALRIRNNYIKCMGEGPIYPPLGREGLSERILLLTVLISWLDEVLATRDKP